MYQASRMQALCAQETLQSAQTIAYKRGGYGFDT